MQRLFLPIFLGFCACKGTTAVPRLESRDATPSAPAAGTGTGLSTAAASTPLPAPTPFKPGAAVNLLDQVPALLAVSSTVENPRDFPEHLIDGQQDTAWNSQTGDLRGWIAFRVPADAHVDAIEMNAGYNRISGKEDLFRANHRIARVAVTRNGTKLKEFALDPEQRGLQVIRVDAPGGDYKVQVLETVPGAKSAWKELVVSEFRVVGTPGVARRAVTDRLRISLRALATKDEAPPLIDSIAQIPAYRARALAGACSAWLKNLSEQLAVEKLAVEKLEENDQHLKPGVPFCVEEPLELPFTSVAPYKSVHAVRVSNGIGSHRELVVETARGFFFTSIRWAENDPRDPGCPSIVRNISVEEVRVEHGYLVAIVAGERMGYVEVPNVAPDFDDGMRVELVRSVYWSKDDGTAFQTQYWSAQYNQNFGSKLQPRNNRRYRAGMDPVSIPGLPWSTIAWRGLRPFRITQSGTLQPQD
jgi:hypothetical protein